ncbi:hypothetical protein F7R91_06795 [Streptomyces luteolifulvus]|uniref:Uncharacterized protein n=1 Tax=Streptomyces luteolifulvus TaxID=2615112 RepID=A0A6H9V9U0_9ACTN|nr:hypothetical protein [Streptomyces luteolifulvus]KAB1149446.1 hypothetical protein F7R91_06795 [Streptomyces luteolifulvus]
MKPSTRTITLLPAVQDEPPCVVISLDRVRSRRLLRAARRTQLLPPVVNSWGTLHAYGQLLTRRPRPLAVLDVPDEGCAQELAQRVCILGRLAPLTVLAPEGTCPATLLEAGATNVLDRGMPIEELAARLTADQRWAARNEPHTSRLRGPEPLPQQASQRVLLSLILADPRPWCCHELTLLLGSAEQPLTRAALRARMSRLDPHLARLGLALHRTGGWGRFTYTVTPSTDPGPASRRAA